MLLLIISAVYMRKDCEAFGKREIIAMLRYFNMSCQTDRLPSGRLAAAKLENIDKNAKC